MKKIIFTSTLLLLFFASCVNKGNNETADLEKISDLKTRIHELETEGLEKDQIINESLSFFDEVQQNLEIVEVKKKEIEVLSQNKEISEDDKKWILDQIKSIQLLREKNAKKINALNDIIKGGNKRIKELENMLERLARDVQAKDEQIASLQDELARIDTEYTRLFDAYQEQTQIVDELTDEINTAFYVYGTEKELRENKVIEKQNGLLGIGKKLALSDQFNASYFTKIDILKKNEFVIEGKEIRFISSHNPESYSITTSGEMTKLKIENPKEFWKVSKYLVVLVDK